MTGNGVQNAEGVVFALLVTGYLLWFLILKLRRTRPDLHIGLPIAVAFGLRLLAVAGLSATGLGSSLRGGDEITFLNLAHVLANQPLGHGDFPHGVFKLHVVLFALQLKTGFLTVGALRITQVGISMLGFVLLLGAVHDLANGRAARLGAWLLAFEPSSIFFNGLLHKEPLMELASGLIAFGGVMIWRRLDVRGILLCILGTFIATETRPYAGWFLASAAVMLLLHAALRHMDRPMRAMPLVYAVIIIGFLATPAILQATSKKSLAGLQNSQNANTSGRNPYSSDNLKLESVNFSTRGQIITNLPKRIRDLILRPWPWQLGDTSQRLGAIGTLVAYAILFLFIRYAWLSRGDFFARTGPLIYPLLFMTIAYALSVGNAGTGFRYRSHLITLAISAMVVLREHVLGARSTAREPVAETLTQQTTRRSHEPRLPVPHLGS